MRIFYLLLAFFLFHCSGGLEFSQLSSEEWEDEQSSTVGNDLRCNDEHCTSLETFEIEPSKINVDILFVLDVSTSMKKNLEKLGSSMQSFLSHIKDFEWKIGFTTADHGDHVKRKGRVGEEKAHSYSGSDPHFGRLMRLEYREKVLSETVLHKDNNFSDTIFYDTLTLNNKDRCSFPPFCQGDHEQPLRSLKAAIEIKENKKFFTSDNVVAVVITNEDERDEDKDHATTAQDVVQSFNSKFPDKNFHGFAISVESESCYESQKKKNKSKVSYGKYVQKLASLTQGRNVGICNNDYGPSLDLVSKIIRKNILGNHVVLKAGSPEKGSVKIEIHPVQNTQWQVQGRKIVFIPALKKGTSVSVRYRVR